MQWRIMGTSATSSVYSSDQEVPIMPTLMSCPRWSIMFGLTIHLLRLHSTQFLKGCHKIRSRMADGFSREDESDQNGKEEQNERKSDLFSLKQHLTLSPLAFCDNISCLWQEQAPFQKINHTKLKRTSISNFDSS